MPRGPRRDIPLSDVEKRIPLLSESELDETPVRTAAQAVTIGGEGVLDLARDPKALEALRSAVAGDEAKQEAIEVFKEINPPKFSGKDLLNVKKTTEGALDALSSPTAKFIGRVGLETGIGLKVAGPIGAATGLTRSVGRNIAARAAERTARGIARAAPNMGRVGVGEATASLIAESFDPTLDPESGEFDLRGAIERAVITGTTGALFESLVPGANDIIERLSRGGFKLIDERARPAVEMLLEKGKAAAPGFFSKSRTLQLLDNIAAGSFFGGGKGKRVKREGAEIYDSAAEDLIDAYRTASGDRIATEQLASDLLTGGADAWKLTGKKLYGVIDELTGGGYKVDLNPVIKQLKIASGKSGGGGAKSLLNDIENMRKHGRVSAGNTVSFEDAHEIRSDWLALSRGDGSGEGIEILGKTKALGKRLSGVIDGEMERAFKAIDLRRPGLLEEAPEELIQAWRDADKFWKGGSETFNTPLIRQLAADGPTGLIDAARKNPGTMRIIRETIESIDTPVTTATGEVLTGKQVWDNVKGQMLFEESRRALGGAEGTIKEGLIQGQGMVNNLKASPELWTEAFGKEGYENLIDFFEGAAFAQGKGAQTELPGRIFIQFAQAGAIGGGAGLVFMGVGDPKEVIGGGALILYGPARAAALLASPKFTRRLLKGTDKNVSYIKRTRAMTQAMAMGVREGFIVADGRDMQEEEVPYGTPRPLSALPSHLLPAHIRGPSE